MRKRYQLLWSLLIGLLLLLTMLNGAVYLAFQNEQVQTFMARKASQWLTQKGGMKVQIARIELDPPLRFVLYDVLIRDHHQNPMIAVRRLRTSLAWNHIQDIPEVIRFGATDLDEFNVELRQYEGEETLNINRWANALSGPSDTTDTTGQEIEIRFEQLHGNNGFFALQNRNLPSLPPDQFDPNDMQVDDLQIALGGLVIAGPEIFADIDTLAGQDHSGFALRNLSTDFKLSGQEMWFRAFELAMPHSSLQGTLEMEYRAYGDLGNFFTKVELQGGLENSKLDFRDLEPFSPGLSEQVPPMILEGQFEGPIADFTTENFTLQLQDGSYVMGDFDLEGLPDIDNTMMVWDIHEGLLLKEALASYQIPKAVSIGMQRMGYLDFEGKLVGFLRDFVAYGQFDTELGRFTTDLNLKLPPKREKTSQRARYSGELALANFHVGRLAGQQSSVGRISGIAEIEGKGLGLDKMSARLKADFSRLEAMGYGYRKVHAEGFFEKSFFDGLLTVQDPNLIMDFKGTVNLAREKPVFRFNADLQKARLHALKLTEDTFNLVASVNADFQGLQPEAITGTVQVDSSRIMVPRGQFQFDSLLLVSRRDSQENRVLRLQSDIADAYLEGHYRIDELTEVLRHVVSPYFNDRLMAIKPPRNLNLMADTRLNYGLKVKNVQLVSQLISDAITLNDSVEVQGMLNYKERELSMTGRLPGLFYEDYLMEGLQFDAYGKDSVLSVNGRFSHLLLKGDTLVRDFDTYAASGHDTIDLTASIYSGTNRGELQLNAKADLTGDTVSIRFDRTKLRTGVVNWSLQGKPVKVWHDTVFMMDSLALVHDNQYLGLAGRYDGTAESFLALNFDSVAINSFRALLPESLRPIDGAVYGDMALRQAQKGQLNADITVRPIKVGMSSLGAFHLKSHYNNTHKILRFNGDLDREAEKKLIDFEGFLDQQNDQMEFSAQLNQIKLALLEKFAGNFVNEMEGSMSGQLEANGNISAPDVAGYLTFDEGGATVDYLQTHYRFTDSIKIDQKQIVFNEFQLHDRDDNTAMVNGLIKHDYFTDFELDLAITTDRFLALNTDAGDNELFYGRAYTGGEIALSGPPDNIFLDMALTTKAGTGDIVLPLSQDGSAFAGADFIRYTDEESFFRRDYQVNLDGIRMNFDLTLTEDARGIIVFDEQLNETLEATGSGDLSLKISRDGNFKMYGEYMIDEGSYTFNSFDVIYKTFDLRQDGVISWNGDPYNARLDVEAVYKTRASLVPLLPTRQAGEENTSSAGTGRREPINVLLGLEGELLTPDVRLDFELAQNIDDPLLQRQLQLVREDEDERNKQVVSLLVLNRFVPTDQGGGAENMLGGNALQAGGETSAGELVTQVVNAFVLPRLGQNIDLGINYDNRANPAAQQSQLQGLEVAVGLSLLNDRFNLSGSYGVSQGRDVELSYKVAKNGNIQLKAFERNSGVENYQSPYSNSRTFGFGIFFQERFNQFNEVLPGWLQSPNDELWTPPTDSIDPGAPLPGTNEAEENNKKRKTPLQEPPKQDLPLPESRRKPVQKRSIIQENAIDTAP